MATYKGNIVKVKPVAKSLPPNPILGYDGSRTGRTTTRASSVASSQLPQHKLRRQLLFHDRRSIITGSVWASLQAMYFISPIRCTGQKPDLGARKAVVERILTRQGFAGLQSFALDWKGNAALCEAELHIALDAYGLFALVPPFPQLLAIHIRLGETNRQWQARVDKNPQAPRNLDTSKPPFVVTELELTVLYDAFLAYGQSLAILAPEHRCLDAPTEPPQSLRSHFTHYYTQTGNISLVDALGQRLAPIPIHTERNPEDNLSIFSVIVNAASKLECCREKSLTVESISYLLQQLITAIFFTPDGFIDQELESMKASHAGISSGTFDAAPTVSFDAAIPPDLPIRFAPATSGTHPPMSTTAYDAKASGSRMTRDASLAPADSGSQAGLEYGDDDYDLDHYGWHDFDGDFKDDPYPLTKKEAYILAQRASDGSLSASECADSAMLLIGFGHKLRAPEMPWD